MKKLHPTFGISVDSSEISNNQTLIDLVKKYSLVVISNAVQTNNKESFLEYVSSFGQVLPAMHREYLDPLREKSQMYLQYFDTKNNIEVDDFPYAVGNNFLKEIQNWHQDAAAYSGKKSEHLGFATVKATNKQAIDKTADTAFASSYSAFNNFSPVFKEFLRGLTLELTPAWLTHEGFFLEKVISDNIKEQDYKKLIKEIVHLKSKLGKKIIKPLVATSPWGIEYLDLDPSSVNRVTNLTDTESSNLIEYLTNSITNHCYCYNQDWQENQLVVYDNTRLLHRYIDNASGSHTRNYWRLQVDMKSVLGDNT